MADRLIRSSATHEHIAGVAVAQRKAGVGNQVGQAVSAAQQALLGVPASGTRQVDRAMRLGVSLQARKGSAWGGGQQRQRQLTQQLPLSDCSNRRHTALRSGVITAVTQQPTVRLPSQQQRQQRVWRRPHLSKRASVRAMVACSARAGAEPSSYCDKGETGAALVS